MADLVFAPDLTVQDRVLLENLSSDIARQLNGQPEALDEVPSGSPAKLVQAVPALSLTEQHVRADHDALDRDAHDLAAIKALNDPTSSLFEPTIFSAYDLRNLKLHPFLDRYLFKPYVRWAQSIVRNPTDVVMLNHLLLYSSTSVPSALWLFHRFSYIHGILHLVMTGSYVGPYTLLMHQHIHMRGVLAKRFPLSIIDRLFPYITDPLMGHTWNSYYYHHLKHHHVEGNGPSDLSSTIRYQRDELSHFLHYVGRFLLFVWIELPFYFLRKGQTWIALRVAFSEGMYMFLLATILLKTDWRPTLFVFVLPLVCLRIGLMVGNFGQHAFIDPDAPESDFGSSITLIDVAVSFPLLFSSAFPLSLVDPQAARVVLILCRAIGTATTTATTPLTTKIPADTGVIIPTPSSHKKERMLKRRL